MGDTEVTVTARDEEGLTATCTFRVTVALTVEPPDTGTEAPDAGIGWVAARRRSVREREPVRKA